MKIKRIILFTLAFLLIFLQMNNCTKNNVIGEEVDYTSGIKHLKGYLAYDPSVKTQRPAVLLVHEWWGLNEFAQKRAFKLAELGYVVLAVDMYGDGKLALNPEEAMKLSSETMKNFNDTASNFQAGFDLLKKNPMVDPKRIAAIGYCYGGGIVLNMARRGLDLKGAVTFHGSLVPVKPAKPGTVTAKLLVLNGGDDPFTTTAQIEDLKSEMKNAGAELTFINYPGALHSFTNPASTENGKKYKLPLAYNADADKKSWDEMNKFLTKIFSQ